MNNDNKNNLNQSIDIGGDVKNSNIVIGSNINIGYMKSEINRDRSNFNNELGREKLRIWGEKMTTNEWDWHSLSQAMEYYLAAIKFDPEYQHPWTNLAYIYHLLSQKEKAFECLSKSIKYSDKGPDHPGSHYKRVKEAIDKNLFLSGGTVITPTIPQWFYTKHEKYIR